MKNPFTAKDAAMLGQVDPPPAWDPGDGSGHYLPDEAYFRDQPYVAGSYTWFNSAVRVVVECAMRLADSYEAAPLPASPGHADPQDRMERRGAVPRDPGDRAAFCRELLDWLEAPEGTLSLATLNLYSGDRRLMVRSLGLPGTLACTPDEFREMQACWEQSGFPRDLYYPAEEQKTVIDPTAYLGGVVLKLRRYSAVRWRRREEAEIEALRAQIPTEEQRQERFREACEQFGSSVLLRVAELEEPGKQPDRATVSALYHLYRSVYAAARGEPTESVEAA